MRIHGKLRTVPDGSDQTHFSRYLCTLAAAEQLYDAVYQWNKIGAVDVTKISLAFFHDFQPYLLPDRYDSSTREYQDLILAIKSYADGFFEIVKKYTPEHGALSEQFSRDDGHQLSAFDLTWSYASVLTASNRRAGNAIPWGEPAANTVPTACVGSSATGTYAPAIPEKPCPTPTGIAVTFNLLKKAIFGQNIFLYGSIPELGNFDTTKAVPMDASKYTADKPLWAVRAVVPTAANFEYNYFQIETDGKTVTKEPGPKRTFDQSAEKAAPGVCLSKAAVNDVWTT